MSLLTEPLQYDFFIRALLALSLVSILCALVGAWVVLRGLSYLGDAMSHAVFPGVVVAFLNKGSVLLGALVAAVLTTLGISAVKRYSALKADSAIGIVFVGMFALGVVLLSKAPNFSSDLSHFLIGQALAVSPPQLGQSALLTALVAFTLLSIHKELLLASFDPTEAQAVGLPVQRLESFLLVLIGLVVVLAVQLVGTTLSVSLLVTSSATARLLSRSMSAMIILAALLGTFGGVVGLYLSYFWDSAPGATIVLVNTALFGIVLGWGRLRRS